MALREVIGFFGVEVDDKKLKSFQGSLQQTIGTLGKIGAAIGIAFGASAVAGFIEDQIALGSAINDTANRLGLATDELQKFQFAANQEGVNGEEAARALGLLNKSIGEAVTGNKEAAKTFAETGVAIQDASGKTRPALDVLGDLADHFATLDDPTQKAALAMSVFGKGGQGLIPVLNKGGEGLRTMYKEAEALGGVLSDDLIKTADDAGDQIDKMKFATQGFKNQVVLAVLPTLTDFVTKITGWISAGTKAIKETNAIEVGLYALAAAAGIAAAAWAILNIEIFAIIAIFLALFLIVEDLYTLFTGGDSAIGDFIDSLFGIGTAKRGVEETKTAFDDLTKVLEELVPIGEAIGDIFSEISDAIAAAFGGSNINGAMVFRALLQAVVAQIHSVVTVIKFVTNAMGALFSAVGGNAVLGKLLDKALGAGSAAGLANAGARLQAAANAPEPTLATTQKGFIANGLQHTSNTEIRVYETSNPQETKEKVKEALDDSNLDYQKAFEALALGEAS